MRSATFQILLLAVLVGCSARPPSPRSALATYYSKDGCPQTDEIKAMLEDNIHDGQKYEDTRRFFASIGGRCAITLSSDRGFCDIDLGCTHELRADFVVAQGALENIRIVTGNIYY